MSEHQPAAGPWNYNLEEAPEDELLLWIWKGTTRYVPEVAYKASIKQYSTTPVAFAIINTEGL